MKPERRPAAILSGRGGDTNFERTPASIETCISAPVCDRLPRMNARRAKNTNERRYRLTRNDWFCVDAFTRLITTGGAFGNSGPFAGCDPDLRTAIKRDNLRVFVNFGKPPLRPLEEVDIAVWKRILARLKAAGPYPNHGLFDEALGRVLQEEGLPQEQIDEISASIHQNDEELLGLYDFEKNRIVLFTTLGIELCALRLSVDPVVLRAVVFVHEMGHWFHKMVVGNWPVSALDNTEINLLECIAQWFPSKIFSVDTGILKRRGKTKLAFAKDFVDSFVKLYVGQSSPYHAYKQFNTVDPQVFLAAMKELRRQDGKAMLSHLTNNLPKLSP